MIERLIDPDVWHAIRTRRPGIVVGAIFIVAALLGGIAVTWLTRPLEFSPTTWRKHEDLRPSMARDLVRNGKLIGLSKTEVDHLLTPPPPNESFPEFDYVYYLGPERGLFAIDSEWLCIDFENDAVVAVRLIGD